MFTNERYQDILDRLANSKKVTVNDLSNIYEVSKATIRNDLNRLENKGLLIRTHGGAIARDDSDFNFAYSGFSQRKSANIDLKKIIAKEAIKHINDNECIALDASSTCFELSLLLKNSELKNLTIITNGLRTAEVLKENKNFTVVIIGGIVREDSNSIETLLGVDILNRFIINKFFVSSYSINSKNGLSDFSLQEIDLKKELLSRSETSIALIDSSKFNTKSLAFFATIEDFDLIIADNNPNIQNYISEYQDKVIMIS